MSVCYLVIVFSAYWRCIVCAALTNGLCHLYTCLHAKGWADFYNGHQWGEAASWQRVIETTAQFYCLCVKTDQNSQGSTIQKTAELDLFSEVQASPHVPFYLLLLPGSDVTNESMTRNKTDCWFFFFNDIQGALTCSVFHLQRSRCRLISTKLWWPFLPASACGYLSSWLCNAPI